ncbi:MAG: sensor histidine kinase [Acidobacteria bacterium]|nr:sensor histidine kinase [Acidobacteriota bacterium]
MVSEKWRLALATARALIAILLVGLELYPQWSPLTTASVVYIVYLLYSGVARIWEKRDHGGGDLLRLILDLIVLLVCVVTPPDRTGWMVGIFYVYVLVSALLLLHLREVLVASCVMMVFSLLVGRDHAFPLGPIMVLPGAVAIIAGWYKASVQARLSSLARQSVMFRTEAENARELERQRIAADFHDGPLQSFISFQMRLEVIKKLLARDQKMALDDLGQLQEICRKQITDMRAFVRSMRSSADGASPATSIRQIADDFTKTSGISLNWAVGDAFSGLEPEISHEVLQIVREALHNAQKHSKAAKVTLSAEKVDGALQITVEDNGAGFPFGGAYNLEELELMRMGPESIKRRVRTLSGELVVDSNPGRGASLRIRVPL